MPASFCPHLPLPDSTQHRSQASPQSVVPPLNPTNRNRSPPISPSHEPTCANRPRTTFSTARPNTSSVPQAPKTSGQVAPTDRMLTALAPLIPRTTRSSLDLFKPIQEARQPPASPPDTPASDRSQPHEVNRIASSKPPSRARSVIRQPSPAPLPPAAPNLGSPAQYGNGRSNQVPRLPHPCQSRPVKTSARTHCANPSLCCRRPFLMPVRGHKPIAVRPSRQVSTSVPGRRYSVSRRPLAAEKQSADHASARPPSSSGGHDRHRCSPAVRGVRQHSIATGRRTYPPIPNRIIAASTASHAQKPRPHPATHPSGNSRRQQLQAPGQPS